ncbi:hypothetical protein MMYC01_210452 [Madurella mycetomatis]|uniref:Uncharacterized protein n=1 Tax=Madurella mycetomatis TaxID=100816 RepID=A0A175VP65_9PEZI|nr:hypothetical protein MMYC01_210452 [Madurella mycetomatis]
MVNGTDTQGWTSSPDLRGTSDIIVTCLVTTFLCCWTSVYPNIAAPAEGFWATLRDKLSLACLGILGPDFLIVLATGQRSSARRSFRKFRAEGHADWTITHSFFADMGGFVLEAPGLEQPIPLDGEQLFYLVKRKYVEYPNVTKQELDDRDKSDGLSRLITVFQATWFVVSVIARGIQGLTITTIEITTLSFVVILFGTSWYWKDKPSCVETTILLKSSVHIDDIIGSGGSCATRPYYHTPLDFISRHESALNVMWQYYNELARKIWFSPFTRPVRTRPWNRIPGDMFLWMDFDLELIAAVFILLFSSVFFIAWNSHFPTRFEQMAWRVSSIYMITFGLIGSVWMALWMWILLPQKRLADGHEMSLLEQSLPPHPGQLLMRRFLHWDAAPRREPRLEHIEDANAEDAIPLRSSSRGFVNKARRLLSKTHNISPDKDPHLDTPIGFLIGTSFLSLLYVVFRMYILTEDFVGLRSMPSNAYDTVNWLSFIPHV